MRMAAGRGRVLLVHFRSEGTGAETNLNTDRQAQGKLCAARVARYSPVSQTAVQCGQRDSGQLRLET